MITKKVYLKPYVLDYIRNHPDYDDPDVGRMSDKQRYCTILLADNPMHYSGDFDVPYLVVEDVRYENGDGYYYYRILEPEILRNLHVATTHVHQQEPFRIELEDKLFEI